MLYNICLQINVELTADLAEKIKPLFDHDCLVYSTEGKTYLEIDSEDKIEKTITDIINNLLKLGIEVVGIQTT